jgi:hypothetical protein
MIQEIKAHDSTVWSIAIHEKPKGFDGIVILTGNYLLNVIGGADK